LGIPCDRQVTVLGAFQVQNLAVQIQTSSYTGSLLQTLQREVKVVGNPRSFHPKAGKNRRARSKGEL
jgi:hypothetical protein